MNNTPCRECGEPVEDSIGDVYELCQECSRDWWRMMNQIAAKGASHVEAT